MGRSATPKRRIGKVSNDYSNYLAMLVVDGIHAAAYRGPLDEDDPADDFVRACKAENGTFAVGKGTGVIAEIGGCGVAEIHRLGDAIVVPEHYSDEDDADAEAALDRVIAEHPTTNPKHLGTVEVKSGVLLLTGLLEKGPKLDPAKVKKAGVVATKAGCAIAVKPGKYDVWREAFKKEPEGSWGSMPSRVRVVPAGTKVTKGEPIAKVAAAAAQTATAGTRRLLDPKAGWFAIQSLAVAKDGRVFAGELGRYGVAAWAPDGTLLWEKAVRKAPKAKPDYGQTVHVQLVGEDLLVMFGYGKELVVLDAKTGKEKRAMPIPVSRAFQVVGDRLVLRESVETTVLSYPALKPLAKHEEYCNRDGIAVSRDREWLVVHGHEFHVYDGKAAKHLRTVAPDDDPSAIAFTHDGVLVTGDGSARLRFWDPKSGKRLAQIDAAKERSRKPAINALATSARHIAAARDDGTVVLVDAKSRKVIKLFEKHAVALPGTGATSLDALAFSDDGKTLWVGAGIKGQPVGATAYPLG